MKQNSSTLRPAIAMIELILALVIMAIIMASTPLLISTASKSGYVTMQQEAINEAASQVNIIMGYHWDESNTDTSFVDTILVTNGHIDLNASGTTGRRVGTPLNSDRSFIRSDGTSNIPTTTIALLGSDAADRDDVDDFDGNTSLTLTLEGVSGAGEYIETTTIDIDTRVNYVSDNVVGGTGNYQDGSITFNPFTATAGTSNIKEIVVTVTSSSGQDELDKNITLRAFSCNIGGYELAERSSF